MNDIKDVKKAWAQDATCTRGNWINEREARLKQIAEAKVCEQGVDLRFTYTIYS